MFNLIQVLPSLIYKVSVEGKTLTSISEML